MTTILVVDDEPDLEALITQKFRRQIRDGVFSFMFARDGVEALETAARHPELDLVLADINMPRMDGLTLLARLQEATDPLATVIVSAYGDMSNIRTAMNRGAFDFLTKPIDFADVEATIAKTLRFVGAAREARSKRAIAERAHAALARYFSPNLAAELAGDGRSLDLAARRRDLTTVFTDVTGFTGLVETLEPAVLAKLLNGYFTGMTDIVFAHGGTVAKIMGDALLVLFGAPADQDDHAARAVACALDIDTFAEQHRTAVLVEGVRFGATRIGVNSGPALVGDFGGGRYFDYTAYGDTLNTASRLEAANKALGTRICVSAHVIERAPGLKVRPVGDLLLRGRTEPLRAYEPLHSNVGATSDAYAAAFDKMAAGDLGAMAAFAALVGATPDDPLANFHLRRLLNGQSGVAVDLR
jgi:adenylate cyclase